MSVIAIIAVQCKLSENGYHVGVMRVIQVAQSKLALNYNRLSSALKHACLVWLTPTQWLQKHVYSNLLIFL